MEFYVCNKCGKIIGKKSEIIKEDFIHIKKQWGYFSEKDGEIHEFSLCEKCYDEILKGFKVPADISEAKEVM